LPPLKLQNFAELDGQLKIERSGNLERGQATLPNLQINKA